MAPKRYKDGIAAPRPMRTTSELGRVLIQMEVPDCKCPLARACQDPDDCPGERQCETCPIMPLGGEPCEHVQRARHGISIDLWAQLLLAYDREGYADRPLDSAPRQAVTSDARVALYMDRARRGVELFHPADIHADRLDPVSVQAGKGKVELTIRTTREGRQ